MHFDGCNSQVKKSPYNVWNFIFVFCVRKANYPQHTSTKKKGFFSISVASVKALTRFTFWRYYHLQRFSKLKGTRNKWCVFMLMVRSTEVCTDFSETVHCLRVLLNVRIFLFVELKGKKKPPLASLREEYPLNIPESLTDISLFLNQRGYTYRVIDSLNRKYDGVAPPLSQFSNVFSCEKKLSWWKRFRTAVDFFWQIAWSTKVLNEKCEGSTFTKKFWSFQKVLFHRCSIFVNWGQTCTEKRQVKDYFNNNKFLLLVFISFFFFWDNTKMDFKHFVRFLSSVDSLFPSALWDA